MFNSLCKGIFIILGVYKSKRHFLLSLFERKVLSTKVVIDNIQIVEYTLFIDGSLCYKSALCGAYIASCHDVSPRKCSNVDQSWINPSSKLLLQRVLNLNSLIYLKIHSMTKFFSCTKKFCIVT